MPNLRRNAAAASVSIGASNRVPMCAKLAEKIGLERIVAAMRTVTALTHFPPGLLPLIASFLGVDFIVVAGGLDILGNVLASTVCYSLDSKTWRTVVPKMTSVRSAATVAIDGRMMVFGGSDANGSVLATCEAFDPVTSEWKALPPMSTPRMCASAVAWEGRAFVIGGWNGLTVLSSVECFDPTLNRWSAIAPLTTARYLAAAVAVHGRGLLVMGGYSNRHVNRDPPILQSAELYDPATKKWTAMRWQLRKPLSHFVVHCIDGVLYLVGGYTSDGPTNSEFWSMDLKAAMPVWSLFASLPIALQWLSIPSVVV